MNILKVLLKILSVVYTSIVWIVQFLFLVSFPILFGIMFLFWEVSPRYTDGTLIPVGEVAELFWRNSPQEFLWFVFSWSLIGFFMFTLSTIFVLRKRKEEFTKLEIRKKEWAEREKRGEEAELIRVEKEAKIKKEEEEQLRRLVTGIAREVAQEEIVKSKQ